MKSRGKMIYRREKHLPDTQPIQDTNFLDENRFKLFKNLNSNLTKKGDEK